MKALTDRQAAALEKFQKQGDTAGIDRGMICALVNKGYLEVEPMPATSKATKAEKHVIYDPSDRNRLVRKPGQGAWVMDNAVFANAGAAKSFLTRSQRKVAQMLLEGKQPPRYLDGIAQWTIAPMSEYLKLDTQVERVNFVSGEKYWEDVNTPNYCSPSSEAYWSM